MPLMGRKNAATVKLMRRIAEAAAVPRRGTAVFGEGHAGMVVGFKGKAGAGGLYTLPYGIGLTWRGLCPCLNLLGSTGKRPVGPERKRSGLTVFCPPVFPRWGAGVFMRLYDDVLLDKKY
jgi:hypothetical protein